MAIFVVDASAALAWCFEDEGTETSGVRKTWYVRLIGVKGSLTRPKRGLEFRHRDSYT
jgi:hypothetical protein